MLPEVVTASLSEGMQGFTSIFEQMGYLPPDLRVDAQTAVKICLEICREEGLVSEIPEINVLETEGTLSIKLGDEVVVLSGELDTSDTVTV